MASIMQGTTPSVTITIDLDDFQLGSVRMKCCLAFALSIALTGGIIPEPVIRLYSQKGGEVIVMDRSIDELARRGGHDLSDVRGLYFWHSKKIYIRHGEDDERILAHEIGHFLFHETRPSWSAEDQAFFTDDEVFARAYEEHYTFSTVSPAIDRIEAVAGKLVE